MQNNIKTRKTCTKNLNVPTDIISALQDIIAYHIESRLESRLEDENKTKDVCFTFDYSTPYQILIARQETEIKAYLGCDIFEDLFDTQKFKLCYATNENLVHFVKKLIQELDEELPTKFATHTYWDFLLVKKDSLMNLIIEKAQEPASENFEQNDDVFIEFLKKRTDNFSKDLDISFMDERIPNTSLTHKVLSAFFGLDTFQVALEENGDEYVIFEKHANEDKESTSFHTPEQAIEKARFLQVNRDDLTNYMDGQCVLNDSYFALDDKRFDELAVSILDGDFSYCLDELTTSGYLFSTLTDHEFEMLCYSKRELFKKFDYCKKESPYYACPLLLTIAKMFGYKKQHLSDDTRTCVIIPFSS